MALVLVDEPMPANPSMGCGQTWPVGSRIYNIPPQEFECSSNVITSGPSGLPNKELIHGHYEHEDDCISMVRQCCTSNASDHCSQAGRTWAT